MKKSIFLLVAAILVFSSLFLGGQIPQAAAKDAKILEFDTMVGVPRPYTAGNGNAIRGVDGGGLPWVIGPTHGELKLNGKIEIKVNGLVFDPNDPVVIARGLARKNTVPAFKAIVSCLSKDAAGNATVVNLSTKTFPADAAGNAQIEDTLSLPQPCIAPIVFVTNPNGAWFAATGF